MSVETVAGLRVAGRLKIESVAADEKVMFDVAEFDDSSAVATVAAPYRVDPVVLLNVMPMAMFVIDMSGTCLFVNDRLVDMLGSPRQDLIGRSALDFIDERDVDFASDLLQAGPRFTGRLMGPSRVRYIDAAGDAHYTEVWAHQAPPEVGVEGYIVTLTSESVRDVLATAISSVASDEPVDRTLGAIAAAARAAPLDGLGSMLIVEPNSSSDAERFRLIGEWPLASDLINAFGTRWRRCLVERTAQDVVDGMVDGGVVDARTAAEMARAGMAAAWIRPVLDGVGEVVAVFIVWRRSVAAVSANQESHIHDIVRLAHLTLEQARHRRELVTAAHRDALTGVENRASLNDRLAEERGHPSVLFIDLDNFKAVNDTYGHGVGDEVIAQVGRRISEAVRRTDAVFRVGGDEFIVVCEGDFDDPRALVALAERISERVGAAYDCREHRVRIGSTVGLASGRPPDGEPRRLQDTIVAADQAMYVAKQRARGDVRHADHLD